MANSKFLGFSRISPACYDGGHARSGRPVSPSAGDGQRPPASPSTATQIHSNEDARRSRQRRRVARLLSSAVIVSVVSFTSTRGRPDEVSAPYREWEVVSDTTEFAGAT